MRKAETSIKRHLIYIAALLLANLVVGVIAFWDYPSSPKSAINQHRSASHGGWNELRVEILRRYPVQSDWIELKVKKVFPSGRDNEQSSPLLTPVTVLQSRMDTLYIVDNRSQRVTELSPQFAVLRQFPSDPHNELVRPTWAAISSDGSLYVLDLNGFNVFSVSGELLRKFKAPVGCNAITIGPNDKLYVNPIFSYSKPESNQPLIMQFDLSGTLVNSFGKRIDKPENRSYDSRVLLTWYRDELLAVFNHRCKMQRYSLDGRLIKDIDIPSRLLREIEQYNLDPKFTAQVPGRVGLISLVAGVSVFRERIFILLDLPRIEILEFDPEGRQRNHYYCSDVERFTGPGNGLVVSQQHDELTFYVLCHAGPGWGILFELSPVPR